MQGTRLGVPVGPRPRQPALLQTPSAVLLTGTASPNIAPEPGLYARLSYHCSMFMLFLFFGLPVAGVI